MRAAGLAGDYELIQVQTQPAGGALRSGRLHLAPLDSAARIAVKGGPVRDLVGWLEPSSGDAARRPDATSRNSERPGAVLAGEHLRLGEIEAVDGYVEHLTITAVAPDGFWGWWRAHPGFAIRIDPGTGHVWPDPAGYFCALRRQPAS